MQFKVATIVAVLAVFNVAGAKPSHHNRAPQPASPADQCQEGTTQCCDLIGMKDDNLIGMVLNTAGQVVQKAAESLNGLIGIQCTPINLLGITQNACTNKPVCCSGMHVDGLIAVGCTPINLTF